MHIAVTNIVTGLLLVAAGAAGVKYTYQIANFTGPQDWLEQLTGPGSTYGVMKLFFLIVALAGLLVATGWGGNIVTSLLGPLRNVLRPGS